MKPHRRLMQALRDISNRKRVQWNEDWNRRYGFQHHRPAMNRAARRKAEGITR